MSLRMMTSLSLYGCVLMLSCTSAGEGGEVVDLWPKGAPGAMGHSAEDKPTLTITTPPEGRRNGAAVVICPGGGYGNLAVDHEGVQIADWLNKRGVTAFMLRYRHAPKYRHPIPLGDAQRAIRWVRAHADQYGVDPSKIGIWGFSAGGHLASTASTHFDQGKADDADPVEQKSSRPDFSILCYPVITLKDPFAHAGSRRNLLGESPAPDLIESLSNETQVTAVTPPTFLFHTTADKAVPPENSLLYYGALCKAGVPCELHIYERGPHGVGLAPKDPILSQWPDQLAAWLGLNGFLNEK